MKEGSYPSDSDAIKQLSTEKPITKASIENFMKLVTTKFFNFVGETKVGVPELVNFLVFKMVLDNGTKQGTTPFTKQIRIPINKDVNILNHKKLLDEFFLLHKQLKSKVGEKGQGAHEASWITEDDGNVTQRTDGYNNYLTQQKNEYIKARMILFFKYLNWNDLVDKNWLMIIVKNHLMKYWYIVVVKI